MERKREIHWTKKPSSSTSLDVFERLVQRAAPAPINEESKQLLQQIRQKTRALADSAHHDLLQKSLRALGVDPEVIEKEHAKADELMLRAMRKQRTKISARRPDLKQRIVRRRKAIQNTVKQARARASETGASITISTPGILYACLYEATGAGRFGSVSDMNEVAIAPYANGARHIIDEDSIRSPGNNRGFQAGSFFVFEYQPSAPGAVYIDVYYELEGVVEIFTGSSCLNHLNNCRAKVTTIVTATQTQYGQDEWYQSPFVDLYNQTATDGESELESVSQSTSIRVQNLPMPIVKTNTLRIAVEVGTTINANGTRWSTRADFGTGDQQILIPLVFVSHYLY